MPSPFVVDVIVPKEVWIRIKKYIPNKRLYNPFWINGKCGTYLKELGFNTFHQNMNFWEQVEEPFYDIVIGRPNGAAACGFCDVVTKLLEIDKSFILLLPTKSMNTKWMRIIQTSYPLQFIFNSKRIKYETKDDGLTNAQYSTVFCCYKIQLPKDIIIV